MNMKLWALSVLIFAAASSGGAAFDTCIYVDRSLNVLRLNPSNTKAELTVDGNVVFICSILPAMAAPVISSGTCEDQPELAFAVFVGSSDQGFTENDLLIFRNDIWYRKCAFTR